MTKIAKFLAAAILLSFATQSHSQIKFSVGPKFGINFSTLSVDPDFYPGSTTITKSGVTGILAAAQVRLMFAGMFGVQVEPGYARKATRWQDNQGGKRTIAISAIQIPILFLVQFLQGPLKPYAFAGPNLGIVASASDKLETQQGTQDTDIKQNVSGMDFAMDFGGGAAFQIAPSIAITGDVRYSLGMTNLNNSPAQAGVQVSSVKSRGFQIQFGALFAI